LHINTRRYVKMGLIELKNEQRPPIWRSFFAVFATVGRKPGKGMGTMLKVLRERARLELERQLRPYRRARKDPRPPEGWLRAMRLAAGIPAERIAAAMGFTVKMVFQTERSEQKRKISLQQLEGMARAMECDLVYGLVPWHRSLEDRAMELVEQELWRKRYTGRKAGKRE
jgi:transcriptional regulator with XRE-family HTH domain